MIGRTFYFKPNQRSFLKSLERLNLKFIITMRWLNYRNTFLIFLVNGCDPAGVIQCEYKPVTDIDVVDVLTLYRILQVSSFFFFF